MAIKQENSKEVIELLRRMWLIRAFEEKVSALYAERQIVGLLHLGIGQEAVAVGALSLLRDDDYVYGGHRSHGHAIAKGADINKLMAEIAGRATGYCGGKGGSMHIVAKECGFITATGVVGGTIPLALGAAFAARPKATPFDAQIVFAERRHETGPAGFDFHLRDLIVFRADDCPAAAVAAKGADGRRPDDKIEAQGNDAGDEQK